MRHFLLICLAFTIIMVSIPGCEKRVSAEELTDKIITLVNDNKLDEALTLSDRFIKDYPDEALGYALKGNILSDLYRREEALEFFLKSLDHLESERDKSALYLYIGQTHYHLNQFEKALEYYDKTMEADSGASAGNSLKRAMVLLVLGRTQEAREQYGRARSVIVNSDKFVTSDYQGNVGEAYSMASWVAFQLDRKEDTMDFADLALGLSQDESVPILLATYLAAFGDKKEAAKTFEGEDLTNVPPLPVATYYAVMGQMDEAEKYFIRSYEAQGSQMQLANWRREIARDKMYPKDVWKNVRELEWFKSRAVGK